MGISYVLAGRRMGVSVFICAGSPADRQHGAECDPALTGDMGDDEVSGTSLFPEAIDDLSRS